MKLDARRTHNEKLLFTVVRRIIVQNRNAVGQTTVTNATITTFLPFMKHRETKEAKTVFKKMSNEHCLDFFG